MNKEHKPVVKWLLLGYVLVLTMVVVGGITRLTGSGLSMADWKPIMGALPPMSEGEWLEKFELYKATPEYKIVNKHFELQDFKQIFWWEFIHRDLGRLIGIVFIIPFILFWIQKRFDKILFKQMLILLLLGALQGVLGWYMVYSGLQKEPHVSHFRLAAHFVTALSVLLYIVWIATGLLFRKTTLNKHLQKVFVFFTVIILVQIIYGAYVAGLKAGFGNYFLEDIVALPSGLKSIVSDGETVLFIHRYLGMFIAGTGLLFYLNNRQKEMLPLQKKGLNIFAVLLTIQVFLGVFTLLYSVPIVLGVLHQVFAVLTISTTVYLVRVSS